MSSRTSGSDDLGRQNAPHWAFSPSLAFEEFSYPRYYITLTKEFGDDATGNSTLEDTPATAVVPTTNLAVAPPTSNNVTPIPPRNGMVVSMPATLQSQAAIQAQAIRDKHAKTTELGFHTLEGMALFKSMKDDLLYIRDTAEHSLGAVDPELAPQRWRASPIWPRPLLDEFNKLEESNDDRPNHG